jgi:amino acid adenylation domain-containing protein
VVQLLDQGAASVAATLGTLIAGAVHVPLDGGEPDARLHSLLERVGPAVIVTDGPGSARVASLGVTTPTLRPDEQLPAPAPAGSASGSRAVSAAAPDDIATIYFTSGSTGAPKGVLDRHRNIVHNAMRYTVALVITPADRLSLVQPPSSSAVMSSIFSALLNGAALFPYRLDAERLGGLAAWIEAERITIYHSVPSILRRALGFGGVLPDVRVVRLEGDRSFGQEMATWRRHFPPGTLVANGLGTTETGLCRQLIVRVEDEVPDGIMPVGHPVTDMTVRITDEQGDALQPGAVGEIAVTSRYLALGYLDDAALTAVAFTTDPLRPELRTYRTGDLGRLRPDGCLEFLGRSDGQSKVLGQRVEPAEVEAALATIPGVRAVGVRVVDDGSGEGRVVAWVVAVVDESELRAGAAARLPAHMRPARWCRVEALPLTATGKVDRRALVEPADDAPTASAGTSDGLEAQVTAIMRGVLRRPIGRHDDFFAMGGDSLGAVDVVLALERATGRRLPPSLLLGAPTVARITEAMAEGSLDGRPSLLAPAASGPGATLVLVPSHYGHPLAYAALARHLEGSRPVLASDASQAVDDGEGEPLESIAARHVAAIRGARPEGPYLLGGFCFGGAVAYEMARQLALAGDAPAGLVLLGVSPYDLPDLVPGEDLERWEASGTLFGTMGRGLRFMRGLAGPDGRRYLADRGRQRARSFRSLASAEGRQRHRLRVSRNARLRPAVGRYRGPAVPIPVTLILPAWSLSAYCDDPVRMWARVGSRVSVHVVPGVERMMLREPVVAEVARIIARDLPA